MVDRVESFNICETKFSQTYGSANAKEEATLRVRDSIQNKMGRIGVEIASASRRKI